MTPREMTAEELERVLGYLANGRNNSADLPFEAARVRAHIAALRARAEAAEADNAALHDAMGDISTQCEAKELRHYAPDDANLSRKLLRVLGDVWLSARAAYSKRHPGTGYRAKVRAELLRELARERREAANSYRKEWPERARHDDAIATGYEGQAAREEQG